MRKGIKAILFFLIVLTGFLGFFFMNRVGLDGAINLGNGLIISPMMLIITAVVLALILMTNIFAWLSIAGAAILLLLTYVFDKTIFEGQQMMAIYLMIFALIDIWLTRDDKNKK